MQVLDVAAYAQLDALGERMRNACTGIIERCGAPMQVCGTGSMCSIYFHQREMRDYRAYFKQPAETAATARFHQQMLSAGVLLAPTATAFLSTAVTEADEGWFLEAFEAAVQDFRQRL